MQGGEPAVRVVDGRVVTAPGVGVVIVGAQWAAESGRPISYTATPTVVGGEMTIPADELDQQIDQPGNPGKGTVP